MKSNPLHGLLTDARSYLLGVVMTAVLAVVIIAALQAAEPAPFSYDAARVEVRPMCAGDDVLEVFVVGFTDNVPNVTTVYGTIHPAAGGPLLCEMPTVRNINIGGDARPFSFWFQRATGDCAALPPGAYTYRHASVTHEATGTRLAAWFSAPVEVAQCNEGRP